MRLIERLTRSIKQRPGNVVLRSDVASFGSASQVSEALRQLQARGVLARIGTGVYAKTRMSSVTGAVIPAGSLESLGAEALQKLGVEIRLGAAAAAYNAGMTTQIPGAVVVNTGRKRIRRRIEVGGRRLVYENDFRDAVAVA
jgi:predicted transcriptional regulator of viral defense system